MTPTTGFLDRTLGEAPYQLYLPRGYDGSGAWPVILFLHGSGERGSDGLLQTGVGLGGAIRRHPDRYPAVVVFPQAPEGTNWQDASGELAREALARTEAEHATDPDRVYLVGFSMGGAGAWHLAQREPERWAALVVVCGFVRANRGLPSPVADPGDDPFRTLAERVGAIPTRLWHGADDGIVPVEESRLAHEALRAAGADVAYEELPGVGHNAWDPAFRSRELPAWLFGRRRGG